MNPDRRRGIYDPWVKVIDSDILNRTNGQGAGQERPKRELEGLHWRGWNLVRKVVEKQNRTGLIVADSERPQPLTLRSAPRREDERPKIRPTRKEQRGVKNPKSQPLPDLFHDEHG